MASRNETLVWIGALVAFFGSAWSVVRAVTHLLGGIARTLSWLFDWAVIIGLVSLATLVAFAVFSTGKNRRPFNFVPVEARWWEYLVFGLTFGFSSVAAILVCAGVFFVLPVLAPFRAVTMGALSREATVTTAILSLPTAWLGLAAAFCYIYAFATAARWGALEIGGRKLFATNVPLYWDLLPAFQFSVATLLNSSATEVRAVAGAQWVVLIQVACGRLLEVITIGVGVALALSRLQADG